ncbi:DsrE family protein [Candidatus Micrarchaeota archaeon]|nr:DsrE family protein [Candidatus Micrarchaeota archaeon]
MKIGLVLGTDDAETAWNALRFGVTSLNSGHEATVFLINRGVELEGIKDEKFNVAQQVGAFIGAKGRLLACGTCLKSRQKKGTGICPVSTMSDLLKIVEESDKLLTFG